MTQQQTVVVLREVDDSDLDAFFAQLRDPDAANLAGDMFEAPDERQAFDAHWRHLRADPSAHLRTIEVDDDAGPRVIGHIRGRNESDEHRVSFWIDREYWGRGITTRALGAFLDEVPHRPVFARVPRHNEAALVVLRKNGFMPVGEETGYIPDRGRVVDELVLRHN
ncbi:GNAT family N-acetyltransferase [Ruania alba]|uniref:Protein N-acetyltransferase, RimJ/RimL family n=1 Tax=Ruania alba TaxID=648782 RepID=A0A1H5CEN0_9MICO|nr:GNAT family protein [Ruania alba]SED65086.1 Protein N-acetyltransferase, RimJ/RimL family [Ruania alba]